MKVRFVQIARRSVLCFLPLTWMATVASADWKDFIPTPYENGAEIRAFASNERDDNRIGGNRLNWDDTFLKEKFTLYSRGYSYHPRFIQYYLALSGALKQEDYSSSFTGPLGWRNRSGVEYNARIYLLPEHSYNLEAFALRLEPLFKEHSATLHNNVETSKGAIFRYQKKPYFFDAKYIYETITSTILTSRITRYGAGGSYYKDFSNSKVFSLSGNYFHPRFTNSQGLNGSSDEYFLSSLIRNRRLSLSSNLSNTSFDQQSPFFESLKSDQFSFLELLTADLPWNFRSDVQYRFQKNTNEIGESSEDIRSTKRKEAVVTIAHRLYQSLDSRYTYRRDSTESTGGDSKGESHYGSVEYSKRTDLGRLLAGTNLGRSETESHGETVVVNEPHSGVLVPSSFLLNESQQIDSLSIQVFLKSPLPPNELIQLQENIHYTVLPEGNTFQIQIFSLPPQFAVPETYNFLVTYSLTTGNFKLRTDTFGYHISFDLFDVFTPYHTYARSRPDVLSGDLPGFLFDSSTWTAGLLFHRRGFHVLGEYQKLDWEVSPFRAIRFEGRYTGSVSPTLSFNAAAEYLNKYYPEGTSPQNENTYREERTILSGRIQKQVFERALRLSAGGSYSRYNSLTDGNAFSFNASVSWRIAKLDFNLGATAYESDVEGIGGLKQKRTHQYYFLNVGRKLF